MHCTAVIVSQCNGQKGWLPFHQVIKRSHIVALVVRYPHDHFLASGNGERVLHSCEHGQNRFFRAMQFTPRLYSGRLDCCSWYHPFRFFGETGLACMYKHTEAAKGCPSLSSCGEKMTKTNAAEWVRSEETKRKKGKCAHGESNPALFVGSEKS